MSYHYPPKMINSSFTIHEEVTEEEDNTPISELSKRARSTNNVSKNYPRYQKHPSYSHMSQRMYYNISPPSKVYNPNSRIGYPVNFSNSFHMSNTSLSSINNPHLIQAQKVRKNILNRKDPNSIMKSSPKINKQLIKRNSINRSIKRKVNKNKVLPKLRVQPTHKHNHIIGDSVSQIYNSSKSQINTSQSNPRLYIKSNLSPLYKNTKKSPMYKNKDSSPLNKNTPKFQIYYTPKSQLSQITPKKMGKVTPIDNISPISINKCESSKSFYSQSTDDTLISNRTTPKFALAAFETPLLFQSHLDLSTHHSSYSQNNLKDYVYSKKDNSWLCQFIYIMLYLFGLILFPFLIVGLGITQYKLSRSRRDLYQSNTHLKWRFIFQVTLIIYFILVVIGLVVILIRFPNLLKGKSQITNLKTM